MAPPKMLDPPGVFDSKSLNFSHVGVIGPSSKVVFISGQTGVDINAEAPSSYEEQVRLACNNLGLCLKAAGATSRDIVKLTYYIVDYDPANRAHTPIIKEFLEGHRPTSTLVPVIGLARKGWLFEIEAVVAVGEGGETEEKEEGGDGSNFDVVVVGGGLSGLQAAHDIQKSGLSVIVLEARDRVGGKTWSRVAKKGCVDVGAAWINDTNQSRMFALSKRFGLELVEQNTNGLCVMQDFGNKCTTFKYGDVPQLESEGLANMIRVRDVFEALCHTKDLRNPVGHDDITLEDFIKEYGGGDISLATISIWTRAMLGCEPSEISALYFLDYCKSGGGIMQMRSDRKNGGQYLRVKTDAECNLTGTQSFSRGLQAAMKPGTVLLNTPVKSISQTATNTQVTTANGTVFTCKKVVVSVPTPLYKDIQFTPPLPADKLALSSSTTLGFTSKMILTFSKPWWATAGFCGLTQSFTGPITVTRDTSIPSLDHYSLTCFIVGSPGRQWATLPKSAREEAILMQLTSMFGTENEANIRNREEVFEQIWTEEEWSKGCPCPYMPPGVLSTIGYALREVVGSIHFVGTETAFEWKGYMEGAVRSGERGAEEVVKALGGQLVRARL